MQTKKLSSKWMILLIHFDDFDTDVFCRALDDLWKRWFLGMVNFE